MTAEHLEPTNRSCSKDFAKFTEKHLFRSLFFNKVASLRLATYI